MLKTSFNCKVTSVWYCTYRGLIPLEPLISIIHHYNHSAKHVLRVLSDDRCLIADQYQWFAPQYSVVVKRSSDSSRFLAHFFFHQGKNFFPSSELQSFSIYYTNCRFPFLLRQPGIVSNALVRLLTFRLPPFKAIKKLVKKTPIEKNYQTNILCMQHAYTFRISEQNY